MKRTRYSVVGILMTMVLMAGLVLAQTREPQPLTRAVIKIDSLTGGGCFPRISADLALQNGYSGMGTNLFRRLIAVDFAAPLTAEKIVQVLGQAGYPGTVERIDAVPRKASFVYLESRRTGVASKGGSCCTLPADSQRPETVN